jgi:hypothetical protein
MIWSIIKVIAPGAERRRVPFGGRPQFRQAPSVRIWRTVGVFMAPLAHLNEFDRRGHKKPAPRKGRGRLTQLGGERGISFADPVVRDGFRIRNPPALARRLAFSLLPAFEQARRGHSQKNPQQMLRVS